MASTQKTAEDRTLGATVAPAVAKRVVTNKPAAAKFHKEVDLSSSKSYTDEERPTKMPRVEATTKNDLTYSTSPATGFDGYIMQCFKDSVSPILMGFVCNATLDVSLQISMRKLFLS